MNIRGKTNKQNLSTNLTLNEACTNNWTKFKRAGTKRKKEFNLEAWKKETSNMISYKHKRRRKKEKTEK